MTDEERKSIDQSLADRTHFVLSAERWQNFCDRLDAPPKELPGLRRLLNEASVLEVQERKGDSGKP